MGIWWIIATFVGMDQQRRIKVVQMTSAANRGAIGVIADAIGREAVTREARCTVVYGRDARPSTLDTFDAGHYPSTLMHYARHRLIDGEGRGSAGPTKRLWRWLEDYQPDVVHLHCLHDHWLNLPLLGRCLRSLGARVILNLHDAWMMTGGCAYPYECTQWQQQCLKCPVRGRSLLQRPPAQWAMKQQFIDDVRERLTLVAPSQFMSRMAGASPLLRVVPCQVIYNGVDTEVFRPCADKEPLILGVAWPWTPRKGLDDMLAVQQALGCRMHLVGLSPGQMRHLPEGVTGCGRIDDPQALAREYSRATLLLNPTRAESFGMTAVEALACGTPVVGYAVGACPEVVTPQVGALVAHGDREALIAAVSEMMDHPIDAAVCRQRAVEDFSLRRMTTGYTQLYHL